MVASRTYQQRGSCRIAPRRVASVVIFADHDDVDAAGGWRGPLSPARSSTSWAKPERPAIRGTPSNDERGSRVPKAEQVSIRVADMDLMSATAGTGRVAGPGVQLVVLMRHRH